MSYESNIRTWERLRAQHANNPDPKVLAMLREFGIEMAERRVADILHASWKASLIIDTLRRGQRLDPATGLVAKGK